MGSPASSPPAGPTAHTAGTSSQIADGAGAVLLMTREKAAALGVAPLATIVDICLVGCDPVLMLEGPIPATRKLLADNQLSMSDIDVVEINEAFASVVLAWEQELKADMDRVNPNGGAIALGHPLGGTGAILITKAVHELRRTDGEHAIVTMCCGGGLGTGTLLRREAVTLMERFEDRRIIVTGGGSGIGQATVLRLLRESAHVHAVDIDGKGLERTVETATADGTNDRLSTGVLDVSDEAAVSAGVADAVHSLGGLDVLVNAAGILRAAHTHECTLEMWNLVINVNLTGTFLMTRAAIPTLLESDHAVIVNFSSTSTSFGHPYMAAYSASKGGIDAFTHAIAMEYGKRGIRAVAVAPGGIESGITETTPGMLPKDTDWNLFAKMSPVVGEGFAPPEVIASIIATLASDDGRWVSGTALRIDGGAHGWRERSHAPLRASRTLGAYRTSTPRCSGGEGERQRPFHTGVRFSMNACGPSRKSSVDALRRAASAVACQSAGSALSVVIRTSASDSRTANGALALISAASDRASSSA